MISAALFGALAATAHCRSIASQFEEAIRRGGVGVESSLAAFAAAFDAARQPLASQTATPTAAKIPRRRRRKQSLAPSFNL